MTIAETAYKVMEEKKMKQSSVALAGGYTPRAFNDLLRGRKRICEEDILRMCQALGITPNELFGESTKNNNHDQSSA